MSLIDAIMNKDISRIKKLIAYGLDPNCTFVGDTSFLGGSALNDINVFETLLKNGANPNYVDKDGDCVLYSMARRTANIRFYELMVKYGVDLHEIHGSCGNTLGNLSFILKYGSRGYEVLKFLLANGADPHVRANNGNTILIDLLRRRILVNGMEFVNLLIDQYKVDVNAKNDLGHTALMVAIRAQLEPYIRRLFEAGANPYMEDAKHVTPLMHACNHYKADTLKLLLDLNVNINANNSEGKTVLDYAIAEKRFKLVKFLLDHGAVANNKIDPPNTSYEIVQELFQRGIITSMEGAVETPSETFDDDNELDYTPQYWGDICLF